MQIQVQSVKSFVYSTNIEAGCLAGGLPILQVLGLGLVLTVSMYGIFTPILSKMADLQ